VKVRPQAVHWYMWFSFCFHCCVRGYMLTEHVWFRVEVSVFETDSRCLQGMAAALAHPQVSRQGLPRMCSEVCVKPGESRLGCRPEG